MAVILTRAASMQYVNSATLFARIKIRLSSGQYKRRSVWDQKEPVQMGIIARMSRPVLVWSGWLGHGPELHLWIINDGRSPPSGGTDGPTALRGFHLVSRVDKPARGQIHPAAGALAADSKLPHLPRTKEPLPPTPTGRRNTRPAHNSFCCLLA